MVVDPAADREELVGKTGGTISEPPVKGGTVLEPPIKDTH
jgi:hypothetical protein